MCKSISLTILGNIHPSIHGFAVIYFQFNWPEMGYTLCLQDVRHTQMGERSQEISLTPANDLIIFQKIWFEHFSKENLYSFYWIQVVDAPRTFQTLTNARSAGEPESGVTTEKIEKWNPTKNKCLLFYLFGDYNIYVHSM